MALLLVFMQLMRDLFAIAKFLYCTDRQTDRQNHTQSADDRYTDATTVDVSN